MSNKQELEQEILQELQAAVTYAYEQYANCDSDYLRDQLFDKWEEARSAFEEYAKETFRKRGAQ